MGRSLTAIVLLVLASGCTIQPDEAPRPIAADERGQFGLRPTGDEAAGSNRIFLLTAATEDQPVRLRSVLRAVPNDPEAILQSLLAGENTEERQAQLSSNLPDELELISARARGPVLTINLSDQFGELSSEALRFAVAQLVATGTEIDNIERVRLQIEGENQVWPVGNGENTEQLLTIYDYPGYLETSQPAYPAIPGANV
jgi:spore germination protein GerM